MSVSSIAARAIAVLALSATTSFALPNTYQVTGPVLAVTADMITVQKGQERWEIARTADTKVTGDLKVGSRVTIEYRMTATSVEVKPAGAAPSKSKK
jgi:hypothetical protein